MKYSIVLSTQPAQFQAATYKGDLAANLSSIAGIGYDGVELAVRDPRLVDYEGLESLVNACNLRVPAIGTGQAWGEEGLSFTNPDPSVRSAAIERIKSHIPGARRFGAVIIIGLIRGIVAKGVSQPQAMDWLVEALQDCSAAALPFNIRLALEPINRYESTLINTVSEGMDLIHRVGAENFGLLLDSFHMNIEEAQIESSIRQCRGRIFHFHVADSNRWYPGAGHLDFRSILAALQENGYDGWVSGEFLPKPDSATAGQKALSFLRSL
jgi:5-keto-L-gluconate epimerase